MMNEVETKAKEKEKMKREMEEEKRRKERVREEFRRVAELMVKRWSEIPQNTGAESATDSDDPWVDEEEREIIQQAYTRRQAEVDDEEMVEEMSETRPVARQSFEPDSSMDSDDLWTDEEEEEEEEEEELRRVRERRLVRKMDKRPGVCQDRDASPDSLWAPGGGRGDSLWAPVEEEKMMLVQFQRIRAEIHFKRKRYREIKREVKKRVMQEAEERRERLRQMFGDAIASEMAREWARAQYSDTDIHTDTDTDTEDLWEEEEEDEEMICEALKKQRKQIEEERKSDGDMATLREEEKQKREMGEEDLWKERERDEEAELRKERERDQFRKVAELMAKKWSEAPQDSDTESATDSDDPWMDEEEKEIILEACRRRQAQIEQERAGGRSGGLRKL